jgi:hypothetical protein
LLFPHFPNTTRPAHPPPSPHLQHPTIHSSCRLLYGNRVSALEDTSRAYSPYSACRSSFAVHLIPTTHKPVNQYLLLSQLTGMGAPTLAHLPPAKAGRLSHSLTHLAPRHVPFFPHHPIIILRGPTLGLKVPTPYTQAKLLPTPTHSLLPHIVLPIPAPQPKVLH